MSEAWIIDGVRTPRGRGKPGGALHSVHPQQLMAGVLRALVDRVGFDVREVDDVVIGNASGEGDHGVCVGRLSVLSADWPVEVPAITVNRYCGSGHSAVNICAMAMMSGQQSVAVAGGVESMSRFRSPPLPMDADNMELRQKRAMVPQGIAADLLAVLYGFSRDDLDAYGKRSHDRAITAQREGRHRKSVVAVTSSSGVLLLDHDELPRENVSIDELARLKPSFAAMGSTHAPGFDDTFDNLALRHYPHISAIEHVHHAGNSSSRSDGAAALLLARPDFAIKAGLKARARIVQTGALGGDPTAMLAAVPAAVRACLSRAGLKVSDIDIWEINEAFAVVPLLTIRDLGLDPARVNVNGGAIALGHPIGSTGPTLIQTALDELERQQKRFALIAMCTGGGMATTTIIERTSG